jgi:hypothetical protein
MMRRKELTRRTVLRGLLAGSAVTIGLPTLDLFLGRNGSALAEEGAGGSGFPRRFGLFFWGNGNIPERWVPEGDGADWIASEQLTPLEHLRDVITVVTGMRLGVPNTAPHFAGAAGILSGTPLQDAYGDNTFAAASVDQIIAAKLGESTRFRSLEFGAEHGGGLSYNGPNSVNPPEGSPFAFFERIFGGSFQLPGEGPIVDPTLALRRSVLDAVMDDISGLNAIVGAADKQRLEQHFDSIRLLEKRLAALEKDPPNLASCAMPPTPDESYPDIEGRPQLSAKNKAFCDTVALALACDQARVFSNFFTYPVSNNLFPDAPKGHHQLTHDEPGDQPEVHKIVLHCMDALAYQIEALKAIPEGDGTLLDHMVLLGTSDVSLGKTHSLDEFPFIFAGGCDGKLKTGIHYRSVGAENASKAVLSLIRAAGADVATFGSEAGEAKEGLGAIEV